MRTAAISILYFLIAFSAFAIDYPERPDPPRLVNDFARMLSEHERDRLENKLVAFDDTTSTQITIVTIKSLSNYEISMYAFELGRRWGIGQEGKNNGVLVLVSRDDRKVFIAVGYGLEGAIPDALAKRIVESKIVPNFKRGEFYDGLHQATDVIILLASGEYTADDIKKKKGFPAGAVMVILLFIFFIFGLRIYSVRRFAKMNDIGFWAAWALMSQADAQRNKYRGFRNHGSGWGGGSSGGFGGGGFGGFGGGSFGGGGAGGSW